MKSTIFENKTETKKLARSYATVLFKKIEGYGRFRSYKETYDNPIRNISDTLIRNGKQYSLEEIIFPTNPDDKGAYWSHSVSLCGKGGTGKTHQFLNLIKEILYGKDSTGELRYAEIIPFYLELNDIDNVNKITDNVLLSELSKSLDIDEEQLKRILTVLNKQVILFADGLNEVNNREIRNAIANSICNIRADYKTRVILSSREDHSYLFNNLGRGLHQRFEKVEICDLTEEQINNYFEGEGISIRYRDIPCLTRKLLATAQGLSMYAELIKAEPDMILEFKTLGSLLQTYCDRIMQIKRNDPREDLSFEDALSYIAYYLVLEGNFQLNTNQLCAKLSEIKKDLHIDDDRISKIFVKHKETDNRERHEDEYEFTHQNFRDYYAALFLAKKLHEINSDNIYPILNKYFKNDNATSYEEILSLCSDFLDAESIQRVINIFVKEKIYNHSYTLSVLIRLFALMNQNNISSIKLDSLDLTNVSLSNYMLYSYNNNNCVSLINTKITEDTFLENGLQTASSTICHYNYDKKEYIYAFSASNALIYDIENNSWKCIRNLPNDGWVNCCCVTYIQENLYILLGCAKNTIRLFDPSNNSKGEIIKLSDSDIGDIESIFSIVGINSHEIIVACNSYGDVFTFDKADICFKINKINSFDSERVKMTKREFDERGISLTSRLTISGDHIYLCFGNEILRCRLPLNEEPCFESFKVFSEKTIIKDIMYSEGKLFLNLGDEISLIDCNDTEADVDTFKLEPENELHHFTKFSESDETGKVIVGVYTINNDYSNIENFYKISQDYDCTDELYKVYGAPINGLQNLATYTGAYFTSPNGGTIKLATVSDDRSVQIITPESEDTETVLHKGSYDGIHYVDVIRDNEILIAQYDGAVSQWKKSRRGFWRCINVFDIHKGWVWKVQHYFNNTDLCFISCSYDGTIKSTNTANGNAETLVNLSLSYSAHPILDFELIFDNNMLNAIWAITEKIIYMWNSKDNSIKKFSMPSDHEFKEYSFRSITLLNKKPYVAVNTKNMNNESQCYIAEIVGDKLKMNISVTKECSFIRSLKTVKVNNNNFIIIGGNKNRSQYLGIYKIIDNDFSYLEKDYQLFADGIQISDYAEINDFIIEVTENSSSEMNLFYLYVVYKNNRISKFNVSIKDNKAMLKHEKTSLVGSQPLSVNISENNIVVGKLNGELTLFDNNLVETYKIKTYANLNTCVKVKLTDCDFGSDENKSKFIENFKGYFEFNHR